MEQGFTSIGLVGAGLIGGSIAARAARTLPGAELRVFDASAGNAAYVAERHPNARVVASLGDLAGCDAIFVATPVSAIPGQVVELLGLPGSEAVVIDTGSSKAAIAEAVGAAGADAGRFVPGHPLAGGVSTGPGHSSPDIVIARPFVLTPGPKTDPAAVARARALIEALGARVVEMEPQAHDRLLAIGSHVPHLIAFALAGLAEPETQELLPTSFRGIAGFAASDPKMWADIFRDNRGQLAEALDLLKNRLDSLAAMAEEPSPERLLDALAEARAKWLALEDDT